MTQTDILLKAKEQIETAKNNRAEIAGQLKGKYAQLKKEFNAADIAQAKRKLASLDKELDRLEATQKAQIEALEKDFPWK
jgi:uncharacterized protein YPO0396